MGAEALIQSQEVEASQVTGSSKVEFLDKKPVANPTKNLRIIGPICIVTGFLMIVIGFSLFALGKKVSLSKSLRFFLFVHFAVLPSTKI